METEPKILLEYHRVLDAPREQVFAALTEAEHLVGWFCDQAESHPQEGGLLEMQWSRDGSTGLRFAGRWAVFEAPRACAYDGGHAGYPLGYAGLVSFLLDAEGAGTALHTRHELPQQPVYEPIADTYRAAWPRALERLAEYVAR